MRGALCQAELAMRHHGQTLAQALGITMQDIRRQSNVAPALTAHQDTPAPPMSVHALTPRGLPPRQIPVPASHSLKQAIATEPEQYLERRVALVQTVQPTILPAQAPAQTERTTIRPARPSAPTTRPAPMQSTQGHTQTDASSGYVQHLLQRPAPTAPSTIQPAPSSLQPPRSPHLQPPSLQAITQLCIGLQLTPRAVQQEALGLTPALSREADGPILYSQTPHSHSSAQALEAPPLSKPQQSPYSHPSAPTERTTIRPATHAPSHSSGTGATASLQTTFQSHTLSPLLAQSTADSPQLSPGPPNMLRPAPAPASPQAVHQELAPQVLSPPQASRTIKSSAQELEATQRQHSPLSQSSLRTSPSVRTPFAFRRELTPQSLGAPPLQPAVRSPVPASPLRARRALAQSRLTINPPTPLHASLTVHRSPALRL